MCNLLEILLITVFCVIICIYLYYMLYSLLHTRYFMLTSNFTEILGKSPSLLSRFYPSIKSIIGVIMRWERITRFGSFSY